MKKTATYIFILISTIAYSQEWETFWATGAYKYSIKHLDNSEEKEYLKGVIANDSTVEVYKRLLFKYEKPKDIAQKEIVRFIESAKKREDRALVEAYKDYSYVVYEMNYICDPKMYKLLSVYHYNSKHQIIDSINLKGKFNWKQPKENSPMYSVTTYSCATNK